MNIPIVISWPQVVLVVISLIGLGLILSMILALGRRRFKWGRGLGGIVLLVVGVSLLWLTFLVQSYMGLTGAIEVARVHAAMTQLPHEMSVELVLYNANGQPTSDNTYIVLGDDWMLQGDIVKFPTWLNILGLHSGYKLTRLEGRYNDPHLERNAKHTVIVLNGGDGAFFKTVQEQAWMSPVIEAAYGNGVFLQADGKTYNVYVSQTGLYAKPAQ
jgi:hypothetical protein